METGDHFERVFHVVDQILKKKKKMSVLFFVRTNFYGYGLGSESALG